MYVTIIKSIDSIKIEDVLFSAFSLSHNFPDSTFSYARTGHVSKMLFIKSILEVDGILETQMISGMNTPRASLSFNELVIF